MLEGFDDRSDEQLLGSLVAQHRRMGEAARQLLADVSEHDRRQAWAKHGASSEEAFLVARLAIAWRTARDWVRIAHALERHPELGESLAQGEVSLDQLGPLVEVMARSHPGSTDPLGPFDEPEGKGTGCRGAGGESSSDGQGASDGQGSSDAQGSSGDGGNEGSGAGDSESAGSTGAGSSGDGESAEALALAGRLSAAQLAAMARRLRRRSEAAAAAAHHRQRVRLVEIEDGTGVYFEGALFDDAAVTFRAALDEFLRQVDPDPATRRYPPVEHSYADALTEMADAWLGGREHHTGRPAVMVHIEPSVLTGGGGWAESTYGLLAAETVRRLACYCHMLTCEDDPAGNPLRLGRSTRTPTWQLAETVRRRDEGCRFPGCRRTRWTHTHHVREWDADGGPTDYDNLCVLCRRHHRLVHEGRWKLTGDPCAELVFTSPDGALSLTSWPKQAIQASAAGPPGDTTPHQREAGHGPPVDGPPGQGRPNPHHGSDSAIPDPAVQERLVPL